MNKQVNIIYHASYIITYIYMIIYVYVNKWYSVWEMAFLSTAIHTIIVAHNNCINHNFCRYTYSMDIIDIIDIIDVTYIPYNMDILYIYNCITQWWHLSPSHSYRGAQDLGTEITFFFDASRSPLPQFINAKDTAFDSTQFFYSIALMISTLW